MRNLTRCPDSMASAPDLSSWRAVLADAAWAIPHTDINHSMTILRMLLILYLWGSVNWGAPQSRQPLKHLAVLQLRWMGVHED